MNHTLKTTGTMKAEDTTKITIRELTKKYKNGSLTPLQYITSQLQRIKNMNPKINAIARLFRIELILKQAEQSTTRYKYGQPLGPFDGIPITIKDTQSSAAVGIEFFKASTIYKLDKRKKDENVFLGNNPPNESVKEVSMLQESGCIILCMTTVPEMCWSATCSSLLYGITRNPHNLNLTSGGSTGGGAALASLGIGKINIGTDGAGSIRIPASICGVIGYKPSLSIGHICNNGPKFPYLSHCK